MPREHASTMPHEHIFDYLSGRCVGPWRDLKKKVRVSFGHSQWHPYVSVFVVLLCGLWKSDPAANSSIEVASLGADMSSLPPLGSVDSNFIHTLSLRLG